MSLKQGHCARRAGEDADTELIKDLPRIPQHGSFHESRLQAQYFFLEGL
jgi:hypothetical protein